MKKVLKEMTVSFASLTKPKRFKNGKHLMALVVDKKFKKEMTEEFNKIWEDEKSSKAKKPVYPVEDWFSKDEETGDILFWLNKKADADPKKQIHFKNAPGCSFTLDDFGIIGKGSVVDVSFDLYYFNSKEYGEMVLRSINAVALRELTPYEGDDGLDGDSLGNAPTADLSEKKDKKKKKKKKKKNKED